MTNNIRCILCGQRTETERIWAAIENNKCLYKCQNCGTFYVSTSFNDYGNKKNLLSHLLSGYVREMNELGKKHVLITDENYQDILNSPMIPKTTNEKINKMLIYLYRKTHNFDEKIPINQNVETAICYAYNNDELKEIVSIIRKNGYIYEKSDLDDNKIALTLEGYQHAEKISNSNSF